MKSRLGMSDDAQNEVDLDPAFSPGWHGYPAAEQILGHRKRKKDDRQELILVNTGVEPATLALSSRYRLESLLA